MDMIVVMHSLACKLAPQHIQVLLDGLQANKAYLMNKCSIVIMAQLEHIIASLVRTSYQVLHLVIQHIAVSCVDFTITQMLTLQHKPQIGMVQQLSIMMVGIQLMVQLMFQVLVVANNN